MTYVTKLHGSFTFDRPLAPEHLAYLDAFANTRRVKRDVEQLLGVPDPLREAVGLPLGPEGAYFIGDGQPRRDDPSVLAYNHPPAGQFSSLNCNWAPTPDGTALENIATPAEDYVQWLDYLLKHFIQPWGYVLNGRVHYQGEDPHDHGFLVVEDNVSSGGRAV